MDYGQVFRPVDLDLKHTQWQCELLLGKDWAIWEHGMLGIFSSSQGVYGYKSLDHMSTVYIGRT